MKHILYNAIEQKKEMIEISGRTAKRYITRGIISPVYKVYSKINSHSKIKINIKDNFIIVQNKDLSFSGAVYIHKEY